MIPINKKISVLHPYVNKKWWAVKMMIYLSNLLQEKWNNITLYTFSYNKELFSSEIWFKVNSFNFIKIAYLIRNSDYIIIWNSPMHFVWVVSKIFFFSSAKLIWWHHHYPWYYSKHTNVFTLFKRYLEKFSIIFIDSIISNSLYLKKSLEKIYKIKTKILYPVMDKQFLEYEYKNKNFNSNTIFTYSRWVEWKNLKQIFTTYDFLKDKVFNLKLIIWWVWEDLDSYKDKYKKDNQVLFLWLLDQKSIISNLEQSNVFLFPSKIDSFWITVLESMSIWVPVVTFNINWVKELVENNVSWFLVNSETEFSEKVYSILENKELNKKLSKNCFNITNRFSNLEFERQLEKIFKQ